VSAVRVNEARVLATTGGADWWGTFRRIYGEEGRLATVTASLGGDLVDVACDDAEHAAWLAEHMQAQGVPATAVRVIR
jgi:hypothetical protein